MRVALSVTCLVDGLFPHMGRATVRLVERLGHEDGVLGVTVEGAAVATGPR